MVKNFLELRLAQINPIQLRKIKKIVYWTRQGYPLTISKIHAIKISLVLVRKKVQMHIERLKLASRRPKLR